MLKAARTNCFRPVVLLSFLVLLTILAYLRSVHAPLILDDFLHIKPSRLRGALTDFSLHFRSVAMFSFRLNYYLSGMNLVAFRITNIIFHVLSACLASYLTYITLTLHSTKMAYQKLGEGKTPLHIALFVAMLFLLHPIQTSAVNYLTQRMAIMACFFSFSGIIFYIKGVNATKWKISLCYYVLSSFSFVLAIFSKENAVMALFMLPTYDFFFLSALEWREFRRRFITLFSILIPLAAIVGYKMHFISTIGMLISLISNPHQPMQWYAWMGMDVHWTPVEYLLTELRVVSRYIVLILCPIPSLMVFDYSNAYPVSKDLFNPLTTFISLLFLASGLFLSLKYAKKMPLISFGILWYLTFIALESFIGLGLDPYFEHRNYLPSFGFFLAMSSLIAYVDEPKIRVRKEVLMLVIALILFVLTFARNGAWTDGTFLWKDAVEKSPNNIRARINLGISYADRGLADKAIQQYEAVLMHNPNEQGAHLNLGEAFLQKGWTDRAIEEFQTVLGLPSQSPPFEGDKHDVHYNLGIAFYNKGWIDKAIEQYQIALQLNPNFAEAHVNLGIAYEKVGSIDRAIEHFQAAVQSDPDSASARYDLATALLKTGKAESAIEQYRIALRLKPAYAEAYNNLGSAYMAIGSIDKAMELFREAIKLNPGFAKAHINLGTAYMTSSILDKAVEEFQTAIKGDPGSAEAHRNLGSVFYRKGRFDEAIEEFQTAIKGDPGSAEAHSSLGDAFFNKNWLDKAIEQYNIVIKLDPGNAVAHYDLGVIYYDVGMANKMNGFIDMARKQFELAIKLNPYEQRFRDALVKTDMPALSGKPKR